MARHHARRHRESEAADLIVSNIALPAVAAAGRAFLTGSHINKTHMIETQAVNVTPAQADKWLMAHYARIEAGKFKQRNISPKVVQRYAADMRCDSWILQPDPITFDTNGDLINGQHRLEAVKKAGKTVPMMVSTGWPAAGKGNKDLDTIDAIDRGRPRSIAHQLQMHGTENSTVIASSVAAFIRILTGGHNIPIGYATTVYILDKLGTRKHIEAMVNIMTHPKARIVGPLAWYRTVNREKADDFATRIENMEFEQGSPPWLFTKFRRDAQRGHSQAVNIRVLCNCLRAWDTGTEITQLRASVVGCEWLASKNKKLLEQIASIVRLPSYPSLVELKSKNGDK